MRREDLRDVPIDWLRDEVQRRERDARVRELLDDAPGSALAQFAKPVLVLVEKR